MKVYTSHRVIELFVIAVTIVSWRAFASDAMFKKASEHVLKIEVDRTFSAYDDIASVTGSGFWLGGKSRFIITNSHVAAPSNVAKYHGVDINGNRFELELAYANPLMDLAYLRPKEREIEGPSSALMFNTEPVENARVFMFGNNGGAGIGLQEGRITNVCNAISTDLWRKCITVSFNGRGGSSGSMVIDNDGKLIGVNFAGSLVNNHVIPAEFLLEDLEALEAGRVPPKHDIGIILHHVPLKTAKDYDNYRGFKDSTSYNEKFPGAKSQLLMVYSCLFGSEGEKVFKPGDIILQVNDIEIGPDLYKYYHALNQMKPKEKARITFMRGGEEREVEISVHDLNSSACHDMIVFGKAILAPVDEQQSFCTGLKVGSVGIFHIPSGSIFPTGWNFSMGNTKETAMIGIIEMGRQEIASLDDVEKELPRLIKKRKFSLSYYDHGLKKINGENLCGAQQAQILYLEYDAQFHQTPVRLTFNQETGGWQRKEIVEKD